MTFADKFIQLDKELFVYLNSLGNETWDQFWVIATNQFSWIPLFIFVYYLIFKAFGLKKGLVVLLIMALLVTFSDQFANLIKHSVQRLRPNNDLNINTYIRILKTPRSYSFYSAHAGTSIAVTVFTTLILKKHYKYIGLLFLWPMIFAYSRIYVGVHFPGDIIAGAIAGTLIGLLFYKIALWVFKKYL